jgi:protoporphyrinogen oxidase
VLEKDSACGGLCRSITKNGYSYDQGGHIIFSRDEEVLDFMVDILGENKELYRRDNAIRYKGRMVKYPFENGLAALPKEDIFDCLYHFLTRDYPEPKNLKEWCYYRFGKGIAERYLVPINEKLWSMGTEEIGLEWVSGRVPEPTVEEIVKSAVGIETEGYTHQLNFHYPRRGGIEALVHAIKAKVRRVETDFCVRHVSRKGGKWIVSDGTREKRYDRLVSTIPIIDLIDALEDVPDKVRKAASGLRYNSLICVMVASRSEKRSDKFAVYFPQKELMFHRACFYDFFGNSCVPAGHSCVVAEITFNENDDACEMSDEELVGHVVSGLESEEFLREGEVCETDVFRRKYAYVVNDLDYGENVKIVREFADEIGINLCGRFSEWKYLNMDDCVRHAMDVASSLATQGEKGPTDRS